MPDEKWSSGGLRAKIEAGAGFVQTQFGFDLDVVRAYVARLLEEGLLEGVGLLIGIGPIRSAKSARWMNENLFGVHVPEPVIARLEQADDQRRRAGASAPSSSKVSARSRVSPART